MTDTTGIDSIEVSSQQGALEAIQRIDSVITSISSNRVAIGAMENRIETTINTILN